jgi:hypothetical protein
MSEALIHVFKFIIIQKINKKSHPKKSRIFKKNLHQHSQGECFVVSGMSGSLHSHGFNFATQLWKPQLIKLHPPP